jgi:hypothetical protein
MLDGYQVLDWLKKNVSGMRLSRQKTLSTLVAGAMQMRGIGVLALGKAIAGPAKTKHKIKQVWRFFRNPNIENLQVSQAIFDSVRPKQGLITVLCDWTDIGLFKQLAFALPRDGRALPFLSLTVLAKQGEHAQVKSERQGLEYLREFCPTGQSFLIIGDRGFGNCRWLEDVRRLGGYFVQRIAGGLSVSVRDYQGLASELPVSRGDKVKDWGRGTLTDAHGFPIRLVTVFEARFKEPWVIVTNLMEESPQEIIRLYKRRMWIEGSFRDMKNRNWGLGMEKARLSSPARHDRLFSVIALAYFLLMAFGAFAEDMGLSKTFRANTENSRVMTLMRIGYCALLVMPIPILAAIKTLRGLPI